MAPRPPTPFSPPQSPLLLEAGSALDQHTAYAPAPDASRDASEELIQVKGYKYPHTKAFLAKYGPEVEAQLVEMFGQQCGNGGTDNLIGVGSFNTSSNADGSLPDDDDEQSDAPLFHVRGYKHPHTVEFLEKFTPEQEADMMAEMPHALGVQTNKKWKRNGNQAEAKVQAKGWGALAYMKDMLTMGFGFVKYFKTEGPKTTAEPEKEQQRLAATQLEARKTRIPLPVRAVPDTSALFPDDNEQRMLTRSQRRELERAVEKGSTTEEASDVEEQIKASLENAKGYQPIVTIFGPGVRIIKHPDGDFDVVVPGENEPAEPAPKVISKAVSKGKSDAASKPKPKPKPKTSIPKRPDSAEFAPLADTCILLKTVATGRVTKPGTAKTTSRTKPILSTQNLARVTQEQYRLVHRGKKDDNADDSEADDEDMSEVSTDDGSEYEP
ncbi:hypothetical protein M011DRAFT_479476 [Sporormia fimetaria CBS 119925]|uniref:Uncharacterized protein n=1 Tax=Sporormia fimetaria CBS 119925 TaxID=1340428 RepID=A0A6A6V536_9PLEO|nr:hypothetical protein M011DRAFT_479476 [Sporormia fimetaria CBS 119925]